MTTIQIENGCMYPLLDPQPRHIDFNVIAASAAKICRFGGHTLFFYAIAQHMTMGTDLVSLEAKPYFALHDAHEALLGFDPTTPCKEALTAVGGGKAVQELQRRSDMAIFNAAGLIYPMPPTIAAEVKHADMVMLATEKRDLMAANDDWGQDLPAPASFVIKPWPWGVAMERYSDLLQRLLPNSYQRSA